MISEEYINEAKRIRIEYLNNLKYIIDEEPKVEDRKKEGLKIQDEMKDILNSEFNDVRKTIELNNKLMVLEKEIIAIQNIIKPYSEKIKKLRDDSDRLFLAIKEKYPDIDNITLENEIMSQINF